MAHMPSAYGDQKRALEPSELAILDSCELPCKCWEPYPSPMKSSLCSELLSQLSSVRIIFQMKVLLY